MLSTMNLWLRHMGGGRSDMGQVHQSMVPIHMSQHTPMVLSYRAMAYRGCDLLNTMNLQTRPMGGCAKYHGTDIAVHGTSRD
jgi:hypothetical protein